MWFWITRRIRLWLLLAVGAPIAARVLATLRDTLERRSGGPTTVTRGLSKAQDFIQSSARGPIGRRRRSPGGHGDEGS